MNWLSMLGIAVGLAMDAFAVSIAAGLSIRQLTGRHIFRLAFHFGLFQFMMPVIGWLAGTAVEGWVGSYDHWVVFALLGFIGGKMLWESLAGDKSRRNGDPTRGALLVTLSVATSIDALAVGLSMGLLGVSVWLPSIVIGLVAGVLTTLGIRFGNRIGAKYGRAAEVVGGLILVGIGLRILLSHIYA